MSLFQDVTIKWDDKSYVIPHNRVMGAIAAIEQHLTLKELHDMTTKRETLKLVVIARAYAAVLRYAGAKNEQVDEEKVYGAIFKSGVSGDLRNAALTAISGLLALMIPPAAIAEAAKGEQGNRKARRRRVAGR